MHLLQKLIWSLDLFQNQIDNSIKQRSSKITDQEYKELKKHYALSKNSKAHGGAWSYSFDLITCKKCKTQFYTYSGVDEWKMGANSVTIQGIIKKTQHNTGVISKAFRKFFGSK